MSLLTGLPAVIGTKAVVGLAAISLAGAGGVAVKAATTGSPNPLVWGHTVTQAVNECKADLPTGQHGIGPCVSAQAKAKGDQTSDQRAHDGQAGDTANAQKGEKGQHGSAADVNKPSETAEPSAKPERADTTTTEPAGSGASSDSHSAKSDSHPSSEASSNPGSSHRTQP